MKKRVHTLYYKLESNRFIYYVYHYVYAIDISQINMGSNFYRYACKGILKRQYVLSWNLKKLSVIGNYQKCSRFQIYNQNNFLLVELIYYNYYFFAPYYPRRNKIKVRKMKHYACIK